MAALATPLVALLAASALAAPAQDYPPELPGARVALYRTVDDVELRAWIYEPAAHSASDSAPAIVFFFGGGWRSGNPAQFAPHCERLAARGMVCITADYRVASRHGVLARECIQDAKAAIRWVRAEAHSLGVDPARIAAGGGSAGGHLAAATATVPDDPDPDVEPSALSAVPNALALFNPATVLAPVPGGLEPAWERRLPELAERFGAPLESVSPYHHVRAGAPPTILFHGKADATVPYETAEMFCDKVRQVGSRCELVGYEDAGHGFFNKSRDEAAFEDTLEKLERFFASLGWIEP